jgi:L-rhamnose mutarotase
MDSDPKTQEWWSVTAPMQEPLPTRNEGEWWASMDEVFLLD